MEEIDLNDNVSVELTEWGAEYLNTTNALKNMNTSQSYQYKVDYKVGDVYQRQFWLLIQDFKEGIIFDKGKVFNKLRKVINKNNYEY